MCLRLVFLLITRVITWLRLSRREEIWKTAEILLLRHQVTVLKRHQARRPKLKWVDRALRTTLFGVIPKRAARGCDCWSPASPPPKGPAAVAEGRRQSRGPTESPAHRTATSSGSVQAWPDKPSPSAPRS